MKVVRFALSFIEKKARLCLYFCLQNLASLLLLAFPYFTGGLIDIIVYTQDQKRLFWFCAAIGIIGFLSLLISFWANLLHAKLFLSASYMMSSHIIGHIHDAPLLKTAKLDPAYLNQRISQDAGALVEFSLYILAGLTEKTIGLLLAFIIIFTVSPVISLATVGSLVIYSVFYLVLKKPLYKKSHQMKESQSLYFAKMYEQLHHVRFVKAHSLKEFFQDRLLNAFHRFRGPYLDWYRLSYFFSSLDSAIITIFQVILYSLGGYLVMQGQMTVGAFIIVTNYFTRLIGSASFYFALGSYYQETLVSHQRLIDILSWEKEVVGLTLPRSIKTITLEDVSFGYDEKEVLVGISQVFRAGHIYALTGLNGAGKSTLAQLILGLFPGNYKGKITYDGIPLEDINLVEVRARLLGYVEQDAPLLTDKIENNVFLGAQLPEAPRKTIENLRLLEFVSNQPAGWQTVISPQSNLSGGEKQRLSISRALLKDPAVLVLDEPSSALDDSTLKGLLAYLKGIKENKIILLITHDERVLEICDEVTVLGA